MKLPLRAVFSCLLFTALFAAGSSLAFFTITTGAQGTEPVRPAKEDSKEDSDNKDNAEGDDSFAPRGPDELFDPLPTEGLHEGIVPEQTWRAAILRIPNPGSWEDRPDDDLSADERYQAGGFVLLLEQMIDYLPHVYLERNRARMHRYGAKFRNADVPRAGTPDVEGKVLVDFDRALESFGADIIFALSFVPGEDGRPAKGACYRYERGGVVSFVEWTLGKLGKPEPDSQFRFLNDKVEELCADIGATTREGEDGPETVRVPHAPIPPMVNSDRALRDFVNLRDALDNGQITKAYLALLTLKKRDPSCGRGALYGMEVYRALAEQSPDPGDHDKYLGESITSGREALKHTPNDVAVRGRLCWNAMSHFNRREWALEGLKQAMTVQPGNVALFDWWVMAYAYDDTLKQGEWLIENALHRVRDGSVELSLGNIYFNAGEFETAVEWYEKSIELNPNDHEAHLSLGLCATYLGERRAKVNSPRAPLAFAKAAEALWRALTLDQQEVAWVYEFYVRAKTRGFTYLPTNSDELDGLFLVQAVRTGLEPTSRTFQWERLVKDVIGTMKRKLRADVREATPDDELFTLKLLARLQFAYVDEDSKDIVHTLWLMREHGLRPDVYNDGMARFAPLVEDYEPPDPDPGD